ncbi:OBAP family protein [archaeon]|nr:OBAP family protein [archaeon]
MNKQLTVTFSIVLLLTVTVVSSVDFLQTADATKSKGNSLPETGSKKVCGDKLCSEVDQSVSSKTKHSESKDKGKHGESLHESKERHDKDKGKMKENHLQMLGKMKSMNKMEMIDSMKSMMSEHHDMKIEKTSQMDRPKLLENIEKMLDKMSKDSHDEMSHDESLYNEMLNPRQIEYPNTLGFSDLHIHAMRHLDVEKSHGAADHLLKTMVHHHCKVYDDNTAACLLFPYGMTDQDKPYGIEYVITTDQFQELPEEEQNYWHYHKTEFPRAEATFPELTDSELAQVLPVLDETYGKVYYFWNYGDTYPMGEPYVLVVQDIPDQ